MRKLANQAASSARSPPTRSFLDDPGRTRDPMFQMLIYDHPVAEQVAMSPAEALEFDCDLALHAALPAE